MVTNIAVNSYNKYKQCKFNCRVNNLESKGSVNFSARPEYTELFEWCIGYTPRTSVFFRRGIAELGDRGRFSDVVNVLKSVFHRCQKPKIMIVGIGKGEEPLSYLSVIKSLNPNRDLSSVVDLHCIDLQPKIDEGEIVDFFNPLGIGDYAGDAFVYDEKREVFKTLPEVKKVLIETFNNPDKSKWDTLAQEFFSNTGDVQGYDIVSMNNVLGYIPDMKEAETLLENVSQRINDKGFLVSDEGHIQQKGYAISKKLKPFAPGIWQKQEF